MGIPYEDNVYEVPAILGRRETSILLLSTYSPRQCAWCWYLCEDIVFADNVVKVSASDSSQSWGRKGRRKEQKKEAVDDAVRTSVFIWTADSWFKTSNAPSLIAPSLHR